MHRSNHIIGIVSAALLAGALCASCASDSASDPQPAAATIRVNTLVADGTRAVSESSDHTFMVLFWQQTAHLASVGKSSAWLAPYLACHAPQPVAFYKYSVFDTHFPYPLPEDSYLHATGYAPGNKLTPDAREGYRRLSASVGTPEKGRYDFLGCDFWDGVYRGSLKDPFAQDKNKLYFRHLAAKLVFYADRDEATMENKQFVRNVQIKNLRMSIDGGREWTPMFTPSVFEWSGLTPETDFTESYANTIAAVKLLAGNESAAASRPQAGYKTAEAETFAGNDSNFVLQRSDTDRVPINGMVIDSCYVCNPMAQGEIQTDQPIRLKMDICAEMSFDPNFPTTVGSGSPTHNLTFIRKWTDVEVGAIYQVESGANGMVQETTQPILAFKPGNEYRIYIHFHRTGVNLAAQELPWNYGGIFYIGIPGGDEQTGKQTGREKTE